MVAAVVVVGDGVSLCFGTSPSNLHSQIYDYYSQSQSQLRVYLIQVTEVSFILHFGMLCLILHGSTVRFFSFVHTWMCINLQLLCISQIWRVCGQHFNFSMHSFLLCRQKALLCVFFGFLSRMLNNYLFISLLLRITKSNFSSLVQCSDGMAMKMIHC